jgi:hypothetical protein
MDRLFRVVVVVAVASVALCACGSELPATEEGASGLTAGAAAAREACNQTPRGPKLEVMTRNLYLGADILPITQATTPQEIVHATTVFWTLVHQTDFPARARVLAAEIFWARPEVLGLQEVTTYRTGDPLVCYGLASPSEPVAGHVELDYLALLQTELRRLGLRYEVAARVTTTDVELCATDPFDPDNPGGLRDLRYTDHDVLLVRSDVKWRNPTLPVPASTLPGDANGARYSQDASAYFQVGGSVIRSWRGWTAAEVRVGHEWVRVFETHLEDWLSSVPPPYPPFIFQLLQAGELVTVLDGSLAMAPLPTIALGDFNSYVTPALSPPVYQYLVGGPFPLGPGLVGVSPLSDAWTALHPQAPGYTWGFDGLLTSGELTTRLDLVLATPDLTPLLEYRVGLFDRTSGGLHASDHAGLVAVFALR